MDKLPVSILDSSSIDWGKDKFCKRDFMQDLKYQFHTIQAIRNFFMNKGFMDILTPPMVQNPGMETHIHPFEVYSKLKAKTQNMFLHTSPEFHMKKVLANTELDLKKIFTITYCFRDEPNSAIHRNQFLMCEWYRKGESYEQIMQDCEELITYTFEYLKKQNVPVKKRLTDIQFKRMTVQEAFIKFANIDILNFLEKSELIEKIKSDFPQVPLPKNEADCEWDDYFFLLFLNEVEPHFEKIDFLLLYEFPFQLSALSTLKESDNRVCERFEIYINGVELCNCFNELTKLSILKKRFQEQAKLKKTIYNYELPAPSEFYQVLSDGYPKSSGIALGVERLLYSLADVENPFFS